MILTTIEVSKPRARYALLDGGPAFDVHLAGPGQRGGVGPCLCGFDRHARDADGKGLHGFSVGGGFSGGSYRHEACAECKSAAGPEPIITGIHAALFDAPINTSTERSEQ